jgi:hypothetical protein
MMTEKKLAPEIKVMIRVRARIRGSRKRRDGNMGNLAPLASQTQKAIQNAAPRSKGTRTWAEVHLYCWNREPSDSVGLNSTFTNLIPSPLQAAQEQDHAHNAQKAADEINLRDDIISAETPRVRARRWEVK